MQEKVNILIIDDHPAVRYGVRSILQLEPGLNVVGEAENEEEAFNVLAKQNADLVIVDVKIPRKDGIEIVQKIKKYYPMIKILAFSIYDEQQKVLGMLKAGADGYLLKSADINEIVTAVNSLMRGDRYISREVADKVIYNVVAAEGYIAEESKTETLSKREEEVLKMLTHDNSYADIARALNISKRTVDTHRYNISKKLGIKSLAGLIRYALNKGLS